MIANKEAQTTGSGVLNLCPHCDKSKNDTDTESQSQGHSLMTTGQTLF